MPYVNPVDALRRLQALKEMSKLGSGFELANRDMEIRGSGAILGTEQSGVVDKVGPEVYLALLAEAIEEAKGTRLTPVAECALLLPGAAHLARAPPLPVASAAREALSTAGTQAGPAGVRELMTPRDLGRLKERWETEHGPLPTAAMRVFRAHWMLACGRRLGVEAMSLDADDVALFCPGWTATIWAHLKPTVREALPTGLQATYSDDDRTLRLKQLGKLRAEKQLKVLLRVLGAMFVFVDGKEAFGF